MRTWKARIVYFTFARALLRRVRRRAVVRLRQNAWWGRRWPKQWLEPSTRSNHPYVVDSTEPSTVTRLRRGKAVPVPGKWVGSFTHGQTRAKRRLEATIKRKTRRATLRAQERAAMKREGY